MVVLCEHNHFSLQLCVLKGGLPRPGCFGLLDPIPPLLVMSLAASSAENPSKPSGAIPNIEADLEELLMLEGSLGASPCEDGEGASPSAGEAPVLTQVKEEIRTEESPCKSLARRLLGAPP